VRTYLDHNATSPLKPAAKAAMLRSFEVVGNASSVHGEGRAAHAALEEAREAVARALGVLAPTVVFTSGGSEANNLALKGTSVERLLIAATEHPSVHEAARARGLPVEIIPVDGAGLLDLVALDRMLAGPSALVSVMLANNETGVIQPVREVVEIASRHGALVHCDAVQALGKIPCNFGLLGIDLMSVSAHKVGGPLGVGALIVRDGVPVAPLIHGGGQELRRRAGTENVPAIAGFAAVVADQSNDIKLLRNQLEASLDGAMIFGSTAPRLPNSTCFGLAGMNAETLLMAFDLAGVAVSSGSACSSGKVARSHVLAAMGVAPELATAAIRVSLGWSTTEADIERFITVWQRLVARHRSRQAA
jgi:cysteine desulfurase